MERIFLKKIKELHVNLRNMTFAELRILLSSNSAFRENSWSEFFSAVVSSALPNQSNY